MSGSLRHNHQSILTGRSTHLARLLFVLIFVCVTAFSALAERSSAAVEPLSVEMIYPANGSGVASEPINAGYQVRGGVAPVLVRCRIDNGLWGTIDPCPPNFTIPPVSNGPHVITLDAIDADGEQYAANSVFFAALPNPASAPAPGKQWYRNGCPAVQLIGVPGSGEEGPFGYEDTLGTPVNQFAVELARRSIEQFGEGAWHSPISVGYPAVPVGFEWDDFGLRLSNDISAKLRSGPYQDSVDTGVRSLVRIVKGQLRGSCAGQTHLVLAGYSQGAQVIGDMLQDWHLHFKADSAGSAISRKALGTVVLFGDPRFNYKSKGMVKKSTFEPTRSGILGARDPAVIHGFKVLSFCHALDPICQDTNVFNAASHANYHVTDARWAANETGWYSAYALGEIAREEVPNIRISVTRMPNLNSQTARFRCKLNSATTGYIIPGDGTCLLRFAITLRSSGSAASTTYLGELFGESGGLGFATVDLDRLKSMLSDCVFLSVCLARKYSIAARVTAVASAPGFHESTLNPADKSQVYTLLNGTGF